MATIPASFEVDLEVVDGGFDSITVRYGWEKGVRPEIASLTKNTDGTYTASGSNFSNMSRVKYWMNFDNVEDGLPSGLKKWNASPSHAQYSIIDDPESFNNGKAIYLNADQTSIDTTTFELPNYSNQIYLESYCSHKFNIFEKEDEPEAPQLKSFRIVEGYGQTSMQGRPLSNDITFKSSDSEIQVSARPNFGGASFHYPSSEQPIKQDEYNKYTMYYSIGDQYTDGMRVIKIGEIEWLTNSGLVAPDHYAAPLSGIPDYHSIIGETIDIKSGLDNQTVGLKRVAVPYYHRSYQSTEIKISSLYVSDSMERFFVSTSSDISGVRNSNSSTLRELSSSVTESTVELNIPGALLSENLYLYRINHDGLISEPVEVDRA